MSSSGHRTGAIGTVSAAVVTGLVDVAFSCRIGKQWVVLGDYRALSFFLWFRLVSAVSVMWWEQENLQLIRHESTVDGGMRGGRGRGRSTFVFYTVRVVFWCQSNLECSGTFLSAQLQLLTGDLR